MVWPKKLDFAKANFGTDCLTPKIKEAFIYLQIAFIKALILYYFDLEIHIRIKIDSFRFAIGEILSLMVLNQSFYNHMIYSGPDLNSFKSNKISQIS